MKKAIVILLLILVVLLAACSQKTDGYVLDEKTFFLVMTNVQYYPAQYVGKNFVFDGFVYDLEDIDGVHHTCIARKCSAGYGCTCGKDTIIGFVIRYDGDLPAPRNQGDDTNDKAWVHCKGQVASATKQDIKVYAYSNGEIDYNTIETISFPVFNLESFSEIEDYSALHYYVTK